MYLYQNHIKQTYAGAVLPTPVFTSARATVGDVLAAEAPGVAQSGSPMGGMTEVRSVESSCSS